MGALPARHVLRLAGPSVSGLDYYADDLEPARRATPRQGVVQGSRNLDMRPGCFLGRMAGGGMKGNYHSIASSNKPQAHALLPRTKDTVRRQKRRSCRRGRGRGEEKGPTGRQGPGYADPLCGMTWTQRAGRRLQTARTRSRTPQP